MWGDTGLAQADDERSSVIALGGPQRKPPGRAGGMAMDHVEGGAPFGIAVCLGQVALQDQSLAVFHQGMADEAQHRSGSRRLLVKAHVWISGQDMGGV